MPVTVTCGEEKVRGVSKKGEQTERTILLLSQPGHVSEIWRGT